MIYRYDFLLFENLKCLKEERFLYSISKLEESLFNCDFGSFLAIICSEFCKNVADMRFDRTKRNIQGFSYLII
jgi:hypothetical protein